MRDRLEGGRAFQSCEEPQYISLLVQCALLGIQSSAFQAPSGHTRISHVYIQLKHKSHRQNTQLIHIQLSLTNQMHTHQTQKSNS